MLVSIYSALSLALGICFDLCTNGQQQTSLFFFATSNMFYSI